VLLNGDWQAIGRRWWSKRRTTMTPAWRLGNRFSQSTASPWPGSNLNRYYIAEEADELARCRDRVTSFDQSFQSRNVKPALTDEVHPGIAWRASWRRHDAPALLERDL
jgi:hypothetical protein